MTSSWSRITDSSSQVDRSGVFVFQYRTFPEEVRGKLSTNNMQCGILKREICVSQSHKLNSSLFWGILSRTSSHPACAECSYLLVLEVWLSFSLSSVSLTSWETNRGTEQFSWHTVCFTLSSCRLCGDVFLFPAALQRFQSHLHLLFCGMCVWKLLHLSRVDVLASSDDLVLQTSFTMQQQHRLFRLSVSLITCIQEYR